MRRAPISTLSVDDNKTLLQSRWTNVPFAPRSWPFFYGWVVLAGATLGTLASIPGQTMGVGVFTDDLIRSLRLSRLDLSTAYMFATITSSFMLPLAGSLIDAFGTRVTAVASALGLGVGLVAVASSPPVAKLLGPVDAGTTWLRTWFDHAPMLSAMAAAFICFLTIRFFGQGCLTMSSRVTVGRWFHHRRGIATAIYQMFVGFGFGASPQLLNWLVMAFGWQAAALIMAVAVGGGMGLIAWVFLRDNPESCGLVVDGVDDPAWHERMTKRTPDIHKEFTRGEAMRTLPFWIFSFGLAAQSLIITAVSFHIVSLGESVGLDRDASYKIFLPIALCGAPANFIGGTLSDRVRLRWIMLAMMVGQAVGLTGLLDFSEPLGWWLFAVGAGSAAGLFGTLITVSWPKFFGRRHLGAISGLNMSIIVFASAIGPVLFAEMWQLTGDYTDVIALCWFMPITIIVLLLWVENPQRRFAPVTADS